jgi:hypothetical protein
MRDVNRLDARVCYGKRCVLITRSSLLVPWFLGCRIGVLLEWGGCDAENSMLAAHRPTEGQLKLVVCMTMGGCDQQDLIAGLCEKGVCCRNRCVAEDSSLAAQMMSLRQVCFASQAEQIKQSGRQMHAASCNAMHVSGRCLLYHCGMCL